MGIYSNKLQKKEDFTIDYLNLYFRYESATGFFFWKVNKASRAKIGMRTGFKNGNGYIVLKLDNYRFQAHQIAWLFNTGSWPIGDIDHIDGDRSNNSILNLREVTRQQNTWNQKRKNGKMIKNNSGVRGVSFNKSRKKWEVTIRAGKRVYIGIFSKFSEAVIARKEAEKKYYKEFAPLKVVAG